MKLKTSESLIKRKKDILGVILLALAAILIFAYVTGESKQYVGSAGAAVAYTLKNFLGAVRYLIPIILLGWSFTEFKYKKISFNYSILWGFILFVIAVSILLHLFSAGLGGTLGDFTSDVIIRRAFGTGGTYIISIALLIVSFILITGISVRKLSGSVFSAIIKIKNFIKIRKKNIKRKNVAKKIKKPTIKLKTKKEDNSKKQYDISKNNKIDIYNIPVELLCEQPVFETAISEEEERGDNLIKVLENFDIEAELAGMQIGPAITRYEVSLKPGIKLSKVRNISSNISMALKAKTVRLLTPIPGKATVGVEVPAIKQDTVYLRTLISSDEFTESSFKIPYCLGKSVSGEVIVSDITEMPHLLIAGATGSGKSVAIHSLIISILFKLSPDEVSLLLIDPKRVELSVYNGIPHLAEDVVTDSKKAVDFLASLIEEMENRYDILVKKSVSDIGSFNKLSEKEGFEKLPHLIVVIDELADLMIMAKDRVENNIIRLAQMSRAVGIHLILATQRPSVDVITGIIKANLPTRIAFNVSSGVDSRTILDTNGAEKLLGKGDMLYSSSKLPQPDRIQGCFVSREEIKKVVEYLKNLKIVSNNLPDLKTKLEEIEKGTDYHDELYPDAVRLVVGMNKASISLIQRKLKIGYNRAARIIDTMEENGIISEGHGLEGREVLVGEDYLENL